MEVQPDDTQETITKRIKDYLSNHNGPETVICQNGGITVTTAGTCLDIIPTKTLETYNVID